MWGDVVLVQIALKCSRISIGNSKLYAMQLPTSSSVCCCTSETSCKKSSPPRSSSSTTAVSCLFKSFPPKNTFGPRFVGLETCDKVRRLFLFPISKQNKNLGFSHVKSGNPDTSRYFVLSGRSAVVSDYTANFSQTKKKSTCRAQVFFSTEVKKKSGIPEKSGGGPSLY